MSIKLLFVCLVFGAQIVLSLERGQVLHVSTQENFNGLGFSGTLPAFDKSLYIAYIENGLFSTNETITLENCDNINNLLLKVTYDKSKYYPIYPIMNNCSVFLDYVFIRKNISIDEHFLDIITLQSFGRTKEGIECILAETHVAVLGLPADDPDECNNCPETASNREFILVDYLYFKVFLLLIACTGVLLLFVQFREICTIGKHINYSNLNENTNYI